MKRIPALLKGDYAVAVGVSVAALVIRGLLDPLLGDDIPFMVPIFAVMTVSTLVGFYPTLLALTVGMVGTKFFFVPPRGSLWSDDPKMQLVLAMYVACGVVFAWFGALLRRARRRAARHREELFAERELNRAAELNLKQTELELLESRTLFAQMVEGMPMLVWMTATDGTPTFFNRRWYEYTGATEEQCLGPGWIEIIHPDDRHRTGLRWELATQTGEVYEIEYRLRAADGSYRWFLGRGEPHRSAQGEVIRWFGTCTDIDDQRRVTESLDEMVRDRTRQLTEANRALSDEIEERKLLEEREKLISAELRRSNEELEKFAYVASHDLQEPLRKIQSFGSRLSDRAPELGESGRDALERVLQAAGRMRRLIDDLLSFSRVSTKPRRPVPVDLNRVLRDVLIDLEVVIQQSGAVVESEPLPTIQADPTQMQQLFQNLIGNALKFRKPDVTPKVRITGRLIPTAAGEGDENSLCELRFADNGIGFEEKYLDRIFQVFQRLHGRAEYEGTGIGLAICRKIAERHGGDITARSRPGEGATFVVTLPPDPAPEQDRVSHEETSQPRDDPRRGR